MFLFFLVVTVIHEFSDVEARIILIIYILFTFKAANDIVFVLDTDHLIISTTDHFPHSLIIPASLFILVRHKLQHGQTLQISF